MSFNIIWSEPAARQLQQLDRSIAKRIFDKVGLLRENPARYVQRLVNSPYYRLHVGDYRVILDIRRDTLRILVVKVGHRSFVYD